MNTIMKKWHFVFLFLAIASVSQAQMANLDDLFIWKASLQDAEIPAGTTTDILIDLTVETGHIIYRERTTLKAETPEGITVGEPVFPKPHTKPDPVEAGVMKKVYDGEAQFRIPLAVGGDVAPGTYPIKVTVGYQGCSQQACFFPQKRNFQTVLTVVKGGAVGNLRMNSQTSSGMATVSQPSNQLESALSRGYLFAFLAVFVAGFFTSFTPCVYPLIPITVTIFGARDSNSKLGGFLLALTYVFGLAVMYASLGYAAAKTGAVFGQYMSNPWVIGGIAAVLVAMGASMLGAFELQLPSSFQAKLGAVGGKGHASAFFMGLIGGIIAAPCTGPMLIAILALVAKEGNPLFGVSLLVTFALGLGMLFLAIGTFSGMISKLPKAGGWMEHVKSMFGIILFAFALYYLRDTIELLRAPLSHSLTTYIVAAVLLAVGLFAGGVHLSYHTPNFTTRAQKTVGVVLCVFALYLGMGSLTAVQAKDIQWVHSIDEGLALAKEQNKPVMIDFWADWCTICKEIEAFTFAKQEVSDELKRFVTIKIDLSEDNEENTAIQNEYNIAGLPLLVFLDSKGNRLPEKRVNEFINAENFLKHVQDVK